MNKKDSSKGEEIKQESKVEVKEEDKGEESTRKRKHDNTLTSPSTAPAKPFPTTILSHSRNLHLWHVRLGTDIQKESQKRPNQARDGKDKVNPKPKSIKVKSQPHEENTT
ncbi:hypothetical protein Tco_0657228 [Tanacetum coccineum]|uniref:Uncharacterized protein n=1 Tax=Tanacetum coccineum TaxID=301880 RepID=A0ABQ4XB71_9ASTR